MLFNCSPEFRYVLLVARIRRLLYRCTRSVTIFLIVAEKPLEGSTIKICMYSTSTLKLSNLLSFSISIAAFGNA